MRPVNDDMIKCINDEFGPKSYLFISLKLTKMIPNFCTEMIENIFKSRVEALPSEFVCNESLSLAALDQNFLICTSGSR